MAESEEKIGHLLRMVRGDNARSSREWVDHYHSHYGIRTATEIEECIANGYVTVGEDKIVRLSADGEKWLEADRV